MSIVFQQHLFYFVHMLPDLHPPDPLGLLWGLLMFVSV